MLTAHLLAGSVLGFVAALWGWAEGYSLWAMIGLYVMDGNMGVAASVAMVGLRKWTGRTFHSGASDDQGRAAVLR